MCVYVSVEWNTLQSPFYQGVAAGRLSYAETSKDVDMVIEAVPEIMDLKKHRGGTPMAPSKRSQNVGIKQLKLVYE